MNRKNYIILCITLIVTGVIVLFSVTDVSADTSAVQEEKETSGYAGINRGKNVTWMYDTDTKTLTFSGNGAMMPNNSGAWLVEREAEAEYRGKIAPTMEEKMYGWHDDMLGTWYIWWEEVEHVVIEEGITEIGKSDFYKFYRLVDVMLPNSLQSIGQKAFFYCGLNSVTIPKGVRSIKDDAFYYSKLNEVIIENGVRGIGESVFAHTQLEKITFPDSVSKYNSDILANCERLRKVTLPSNMKEIPDGFFSDCTSLWKIEIPQSVVKIGEYAFKKTSLRSIELPKSVVEIERSAFLDTPLKKVKLPKSLIKIGSAAFYGTSLRTIEIPKNVEVLGDEHNKHNAWTEGVFSMNDRLRTVKIKSRKLKKVEKVFKAFPSKATIIVPKGKKKSYSKMFYKAGLSKKVKIKESRTW